VSDFDVLIVGGGSAGAVLANRLSADPSRRVALLEAGNAYRANLYPSVLTNADHVAGDAAHDWAYIAETGHFERSIPAWRARALGGCSTVNAAVAIRARAADFAKWTQMGVEGWTFDDVLPAYKSIENTPDGDDSYRGRNGPLPIRQRRAHELTPSLNAFVQASVNEGYALVSDFNGAEQAGVSPYPLNVISGRRINTGIAFLDDGVRARSNLTIIGNVVVDQVVFDGKRAVGVLDAEGKTYSADRVILSAGAYGSPSILLRSGVGPEKHLRELGIPVRADLPVGERLQEHPFYYNIYALKPHANGMHPAAGAILWAASQTAEPGDLDLHVSATHLFDPAQSPTGGAIVLACALTQPESVGTFRLRDRNPRSAPIIKFNLLGTSRDLSRMLECVTISRRVGRNHAFTEVSDIELTPGPDVPDSGPQLERAILQNIDVYAHPTSTVPMGRPGQGVLDSEARVYDFDGLHVVDASIMPIACSAPPNVSVMMFAEHMASKLTRATFSTKSSKR
jgi:choline dehydrogenase